MASVLRSLSASGFVTEVWDTVRLVLHLPCCACRAPRRSGRPRQLPPGLSQDALDALPEPRRQQVDMLLADRAHASSANPAAVSVLAAAASTCSGEGTTSCKCWYTSRTNPLRRCRQGATRPLTAVTVVAVYLRRQSIAIWVLTSLVPGLVIGPCQPCAAGSCWPTGQTACSGRRVCSSRGLSMRSGWLLAECLTKFGCGCCCWPVFSVARSMTQEGDCLQKVHTRCQDSR